MKKRLLKACSLVFGAAFILTGCASVSNVYDKNGKSIYFDDVVYNQGQVVQVGDYLYYGNGYTSSSDSSFNYSDAKKTGFMSRININENLTFSDDVENEYIQDTSPKGVEKVVTSKLVGYEKQDMFALGNYIYFSSPNTHKTSDLENDYSQVSFFRVKFNGDNFQEIDTFRTSDNSAYYVRKGSDNNYYYVIYTIGKDSNYNIYSIKIGDSVGKTNTLAQNVNSVAVCDESSSLKNVYYTVKNENTNQETTSVKAVDFATGEIEDLDNGVAGSKTEFLGRVGDKVYYTYTYKAVSQVYEKDVANSDKVFNPTPSQRFYNASAVKNVKIVGNGVMFVSSTSSSVMYKDSSDDASLMLTKEEYSDILFTDGDYIYYSSSTEIGRKNVIDGSKQTIVSLSNIQSGKCGYTGDYIYFYAQKQNKKEDDNDNSYYMYRTDKQGNYQMIGKTK